MKTKLLFCFIFLFPICYTFAQKVQIKGDIVDKEASSNLINASVGILQAKDSILLKFTRVAADGSFKFNNMPIGDYILLVTYPDYADYVESFKLIETITTKDFGKIGLISKARLLNEVIVKGEAISMKVNGDTTEFNAGSFKVQPNAKVEDLLKQLPGISIDKDGKITAQGQTVNRVLVDGEEFFGDDPTLVTKNIRSDMVDKVQLYDDKSENAKFTGIDDGQISKTINLKLKEDKKKGYFGKLDAGGGNDDFYSTQGLLNFFNNKKKLSVYSTNGNTRRTGLDWEASRKLGVGGSSNIEISDDGGVMYFGSGGDSFSNQNFYGEGVPKIINTGIHFENKWKEDKHAINLDYKYGVLDNLGFKNTVNQNNLPNNLLVNNTNNNFDNSLNQNKLNVIYDFKIDTSSNIKVTLENSVRNRSNVSTTLNSGFSNTNNLINDGSRNSNENIAENKLATTLFYGKKFKKPGRTLAFRFNQSYSDKQSEGFLISNIDFYNNNQLTRTDKINQFKDTDQESENYKTSLTFTEKLTKSISLSTNYDFSFTKSLSKLGSFNTDASGNYTQLDPLFSNDLNFDINTHQGGLTFAYKKDKTNLSVGSKLAFSNLQQENLIAKTSFDRDFTNFVPSIIYTYSFTKQKRISFNYNGYTRQPNINQLQPVLNNNDPLNITLGNRDLGIAFEQRFSINYNSYKVLTERGLYFNLDYNFSSNDIISNINTNQEGFSTVTFQNLNGKTPSSFNSYFDYNSKLGKSKWQFGVGFGNYGNTNYNIINNEVNQNTNLNTNARFTISRYTDNSTLYINLGPGYRISKSSLQSLRNANGVIFDSYFEFTQKLSKKIRLQIEGESNFQEASSSFNTNFSQYIINTSIEKSFLEKEKLKLSISGNDLFNQNAGFTRNVSGNNITQTSFNNIQRYFLLSLSWDFSKFGTLK
jgi:hypothetical protein